MIPFTRISTVLSCAALAVLALLPMHAGANLLVNGSFEVGADPGLYTTKPAGDVSIAGWVVSQGAIDYVGTAWAHSDGQRSLDLNALNTDAPGGISQTFATTPGQTYFVNFDLAGNPSGVPVIKTVQVEAATQTGVFSFDTTGLNPFFMGWTTQSWSFIADSNTATLTFRTLDIATSYGPALDNVVVTTVPEPSSLLALSPLFAAALMRRRR